MQEEILSELPAAQNWMFILFMLCFFISMQILGASRKLFSSMLYGLFREKDRPSIFSEAVDNEVVSKILLCLQTIILSAIIIHCSFSHVWGLQFDTTLQLFRQLGEITCLLLVVIVYKFLINLLISSVFFQKEAVQLFNDNFFSILALSGLVLFFSALLLFYVKEAYFICFYFSIAYFVFIELLIGYKIFVIFFQQKETLFYFILYLCAQELVPLYLLYKAIIYFYFMR